MRNSAWKKRLTERFVLIFYCLILIFRKIPKVSTRNEKEKIPSMKSISPIPNSIEVYSLETTHGFNSKLSASSSSDVKNIVLHYE